ncbi:hypothetical protein AAVH_14072 [Aphelenchoides avenae]|nr:hypothetical protein AAVH_14072 [Aphelenchus avenae]
MSERDKAWSKASGSRPSANRNPSYELAHKEIPADLEKAIDEEIMEEEQREHVMEQPPLLAKIAVCVISGVVMVLCIAKLFIK